MSIYSDFMRGWRNIDRRGKLEYGALVSAALLVMLICGQITYYYYLKPYWDLAHDTVTGELANKIEARTPK